MVKINFFKKHYFILLFIALGLMSYYSIFLSKIENFNVPTNQNLKENLFKIAKNIEIQGKIIGDTYLFGKDIEIDGDIDGNLIIIGQNINLSTKSHISNNLILIGNKISVNGQVGGSVYTAGNYFESFNLFTVHGSLYARSRTAKVAGTINSSFFAEADRMNVDATIVGKSRLKVNNLSIDHNAKLRSLEYQASNNNVIKNDNSILSQEKIKASRISILDYFWRITMKSLFYLFIVIIILNLFPSFQKNNLIKNKSLIEFSRYSIRGVFLLFLSILIVPILILYLPLLVLFLATMLVIKIIYLPLVLYIFANFINDKFNLRTNKYFKLFIIFFVFNTAYILFTKIWSVSLICQIVLFSLVMGLIFDGIKVNFKKLNKIY